MQRGDQLTGSPFNRIVHADAREALNALPPGSVDLSFWSPPYFVGKSYEQHLEFDGWQQMIRETVAAHEPVIRPGGFLAVNIADILCFSDPSMPRFLADNVQSKRSAVTREQAADAKARNPGLNRHQLAALLGCSEQTVQRRLDGNNVRGGKYDSPTKVKLTGALLADWAEAAGFYLYDRRIWHKDPCWANGRWHSSSYRAVDEFEYIYVFWKPGGTTYDRNRLTADEWVHWGSRGVWRIASVRNNDRHEAEFPEALAERVIRLLSPPGGVVIDPFSGAGTTARVARRLGRAWFGCDADVQCVRMAQHRVKEPFCADLFDAFTPKPAASNEDQPDRASSLL